MKKINLFDFYEICEINKTHYILVQVQLYRNLSKMFLKYQKSKFSKI